MCLFPSPPKQEEVGKYYRELWDHKVHRVHVACLPSHHRLLWLGGSAPVLPSWLQAPRGRRSLHAGFGRSCWQGVSLWHQHQRNAPQCSRDVLETSQRVSCKSSAPAWPPAAASPSPSGSSPRPACQSCRVLRLLQRLQVDSLMLQEWFVLQPLSWPGISRWGGGDMQHGYAAPVSCICPLSPERIFTPTMGRHCCLKGKPRHSPQHPALWLQGLSPQLGEHPGPWLLPFLSLLSAS